MKAKDIYKMWVNHDMGVGYELYLVLPLANEGKNITLTSKKKDYCDFPRNIHIYYEETTWKDYSKIKCDLKNSDNLFLNLKYRGFNMKNIDVWSELELDNFNVDRDSGKLVFVFTYKGGF